MSPVSAAIVEPVVPTIQPAAPITGASNAKRAHSPARLCSEDPSSSEDSSSSFWVSKVWDGFHIGSDWVPETIFSPKR